MIAPFTLARLPRNDQLADEKIRAGPETGEPANRDFVGVGRLGFVQRTATSDTAGGEMPMNTRHGAGAG